MHRNVSDTIESDVHFPLPTLYARPDPCLLAVMANWSFLVHLLKRVCRSAVCPHETACCSEIENYSARPVPIVSRWSSKRVLEA